MDYLSLAMAQINTIVGDLEGNAEKIIRATREAAGARAQLIVFPELALSGYPPEDLVLKKHFIQHCEEISERLAKELPPEIIAVVGTPVSGVLKACNAAVILSGGALTAIYRKTLLPNYGVFDEQRVFEPGQKPLLLKASGARIGIHVCEDSWDTEAPPFNAARKLKLDVLLNLSASPYHRGKHSVREEVFVNCARNLKAHVAYCNLVGGQDELIFDGGSKVISPDGDITSRAAQFEECIQYASIPIRGVETPPGETEAVETIELHTAGASARKSECTESVIEPCGPLEEIYSALKLGLRDYTDKNGFKKVIIAISGGIDSALVATLAVDALGPERVAGITMPSAYSSAETRGDANELARKLEIDFLNIGIGELYDNYLKTLTPLWPDRDPDAAEENLQARIRGNIVMALSNKFNWLVLTTGNKSELATGYCTLYGDMAGGFAVIKDLPKTLVFELCRWRNSQAASPVIPPGTIERPPSAELRPDQKDTDSLPPYEVLDPILERYVEKDMGLQEIVADGFDRDLVRNIIRLVDLNEYKRRQAPPGIKITPKAFGRDRRIPITNRYRI